jgi:hypothetical protein
MEIEKMIRLCKANIKDARQEESTQSKKIEAAHSSTIDIADWNIKQIYDSIVEKCNEQQAANHLHTAHPYNSNPKKEPYVNVVLQWLFAAKRQAMRLVELSVVSQKNLDQKSFHDHSEKGKNLRDKLHKMNESKPQKEHKAKLELADQADLEHQYKELHP